MTCSFIASTYRSIPNVPSGIALAASLALTVNIPLSSSRMVSRSPA